MTKMENNSIMLMLGEIKGDLKSLHDKMDITVTQVKDTNGRVTVLEHWRTGLMARFSLLIIIFGSLWEVIMKKFGN